MPPSTYDFGQLAPPLPTAPGGVDLVRALEAARSEGYDAGRADGSAEGASRVAAAEAALTAAASALVAERDSLADATERAAVELALRLAEKAVTAAIAVDPGLVLEAVRGALRVVMDRERFTVLVHPEDLETVRDGLGAVVAELGGPEHFEVRAERRVARGGAVVRTTQGEVDASLAAKLQRAREVLEDELSGRR